jgi:hypothetical protein
MAVDAPPIARERASVELGARIASQLASLIAFLTASLIASLIAEQLASALRANSARVLDLFRSWDADGDGQVIANDCYRLHPIAYDRL